MLTFRGKTRAHVYQSTKKTATPVEVDATPPSWLDQSEQGEATRADQGYGRSGGEGGGGHFPLLSFQAIRTTIVGRSDLSHPNHVQP